MTTSQSSAAGAQLLRVRNLILGLEPLLEMILGPAVVDGFDESPMPLDTVSAYSKDDSKFTKGEASEVDRIVNALKRGSDESPEKRAYFQQKTKLLRVEEQLLRVGEQEKKRKSDMALAHELRRACKAMDSDDEDDNVLKNRMKSARRRIFERILDEVEGEMAEATLPAATSTVTEQVEE
jgi:hypothetical protein